jgi:hypothetical protein
MGKRKELLTYYGSYCGDYLGHTGVIANAARDFKTVLDRYKFERTAECIFPEALKDYDTFYKALVFMTPRALQRKGFLCLPRMSRL